MWLYRVIPGGDFTEKVFVNTNKAVTKCIHVCIF